MKLTRRLRLILLALAAATAAIIPSPTCAKQTDPSNSARSNVVLIVTDNQGAWTLGCYGNPDIKTPNVDRMAAQGVRFTRAFSSNPVCSPTRATPVPPTQNQAVTKHQGKCTSTV